jgi:hypothetical protein
MTIDAERLIEIWGSLFPELGAGWPESEVLLTEAGLGVRLPALLRAILISTRPPDRDYDFRGVRLLELNGLEWSADARRVLRFAEMSDIGISFGLQEDGVRADGDPLILLGTSGNWHPLQMRLSRWLIDYAFLTRLEASPTTGWIGCDTSVVRALEGAWSPLFVNWNSGTCEKEGGDLGARLRMPLEARLYVEGNVVVEIINSSEIVAAGSTIEALRNALGALGVDPSTWSAD